MSISNLSTQIINRGPAFVAFVLLIILFPDRLLFFSPDLLGRLNLFGDPWITIIMCLGLLCSGLLMAGSNRRLFWILLILIFTWMRASNLVLMQTPEWTFLSLTFFYATLRQTKLHHQINARFMVFGFVAINYFWFGYDKSGWVSTWQTGDFLTYALQGDFFRGDLAETILDLFPSWLLIFATWTAFAGELLAPLIFFSRRFFRAWNYAMIAVHLGGLILFSIFPVSFTMIFFHLWLFSFECENPQKRIQTHQEKVQLDTTHEAGLT